MKHTGTLSMSQTAARPTDPPPPSVMPLAPKANNRRTSAWCLAGRAFLLVAGGLACGLAFSTGCSTGSSEGIRPLPAGFSATQRIENAAAIRITKSGFDFLSDNVAVIAAQAIVAASKTGSGLVGATITPNGNLAIEVPNTAGNVLSVLLNYDICPGGGDAALSPPYCSVEMNLGAADLSIKAEGNSRIHLTGTLPVRIENLGIDLEYFSVAPDHLDVVVGDQSNACPGDSFGFAPIPIDVVLGVESDAQGASVRAGYSKLRIVSVNTTESAVSQAVNYCGSGLTDELLQVLEPVVINFVTSLLRTQISDLIETAMCQRSDPDKDILCPTGSYDVSGICREGNKESDACVSIVLGLDGAINLGQFLSSVSPGTRGGLEFLFAAGGLAFHNDGSGLHVGDLDAVGGGATLGFYGGAEPTPVSQCVPQSRIERPTALTIPGVLYDNIPSTWPTAAPAPHIAFALSESFVNYGLSSLFSSGLMCIGITSEISDLLNSGTVGLLDPNVKNLTLQQETQPLAISLRPTSPPRVTFGTGADLATDPVVRIQMEGTSVDFFVWSHDRFIRFLTVSFDLDAPLNLDIDQSGLTPVIETLSITNAKVTHAELLGSDPERLATAIVDLLQGQVGQLLGSAIPKIKFNEQLKAFGLALDLPPTVDGVGSPALTKIVEGNENFLGIFATLGVVDVESVNTEADILVVDSEASGGRLDTMRPGNETTVQLLARATDSGGDLPAGSTEFSTRIDAGLWSTWRTGPILELTDPWLRLPGEHAIEVRARRKAVPQSADLLPVKLQVVVAEELPSATERVEIASPEPEVLSVQNELINGSLPKGPGGACSFSAGRSSSASTNAGQFALLGAFLAMGVRRRRRFRSMLAKAAALIPALIVVAVFVSGCGCENDGPAYQCTGDCKDLAPGAVGAYSSVAGHAGNLWAAAYADGDWEKGYAWGDLVVGSYQGSGFVWEAVDGVPTSPAVDGTKYNRNGFRGGQTARGDDVGLWTSIALSDLQLPTVSYYDRTNQSLKLAMRTPLGWQIAVVNGREASDIGRYSKLIFENGRPTVIYQVIEHGGSGEKLRSLVRIARANSAYPQTGDFTYEDVIVDDATPCRPRLCLSGETCLTSGECAPAAAGESCNCNGSDICVSVDGKAKCATAVANTKLDTVPSAIGNYIAVARQSDGTLGIAQYDRIRGELSVLRAVAGGWKATVVEGREAEGESPEDAGMGLSLTIDKDNVWHLAYADAHNETIRYARLPGGSKVELLTTVDDGLEVAQATSDDSKHLLGGDTAIFVRPSGQVYVAYQDLSAGELRYGIGRYEDGEIAFDVTSLAQQGPAGEWVFAGSFAQFVFAADQLYLANTWRSGGAAARMNVSLLAMP